MNFFKKIFLIQKNKFINKLNDNEDRVVINFFRKLDKNKIWKYLEVGSGLGRFPIKIKKQFLNINIECVEINPGLAEKTLLAGFPTNISSVLSLPYENESFDIVHCSHVIEHFKYPEITQVLDNLLYITKSGGYIIIRSPLWHKDFYLDIDHVRPYPPETILNYFKNEQQQKVGIGNLEIVKCWYRKENLKIFNTGVSKFKYFLNSFLAISWLYFKFPISKKNGYVLILKKK